MAETKAAPRDLDRGGEPDELPKEFTPPYVLAWRAIRWAVRSLTDKRARQVTEAEWRAVKEAEALRASVEALKHQIEHRDGIIHILEAEVAKLTAVCARDLERVKAETAVFIARQERLRGGQ